MKKRAVILASLIAGWAGVLAADTHPNTARGFDIGKPYQMNGLDNVNLFNGNLTVTIPIGQRYHVNGNLSYGLTLVYSGNVWDTVSVDPNACNQSSTYPNRRSNAGLGWLISLGRLFAHNQYPIQESVNDNYETPDGALHEFHTGLHDDVVTGNAYQYTRDGSYIRMITAANDASRTIEFPDGTTQLFVKLKRPANAQGVPESGYGGWVDGGRWRLKSINDKFGNSVAVDYSSEAAQGGFPEYPEVWTIADGARTQKVYFKVSPHAADEVVVDRVVLATYSGTGSWQLAYDARDLGVGATNQGCSTNNIAHNVPLLTSVTLPAVGGVSQTFSMIAPGGGAVPYYNLGQTVNALNGHLLGLQLPTKGWLEWDYETFSFYGGSLPVNHSAAVKHRYMRTADRTHIDTWTYARQASANPTCVNPTTHETVIAPPEQLVASVTSPEQVTSVHYFSTWSAEYSGCGITSSFLEDEYSLPFTRGASKTLGSKTLFLTQETFTGTPPSLATGPGSYRVAGGTRVRSEWATYDYDAAGGKATDRNFRETAHATFYDDDGNCGGTCYAAVARYGFDGAGHFRQSSTYGNFPGDNFKTAFVKFPDVNTTASSWLLNVFSEKCVVKDSSERTAAVAQCSDLGSGSFHERYCFDANGFLTRRRTMAGTSPLTTDITAEFGQSAGNVTSERYYGGGDTGNAVTGDVCTVGLGSQAYEIAHTYANGSLATSKYKPTSTTAGDPKADDPNFFHVNSSNNANTGLTASSTDPSGLITTYDYDVLGRPKSVSPPGEAATNVAFTEATDTTPAKAKASKIASTPATDTEAQRKVETTTIFDGFGRPIEERRIMPAGSAARQTAYNGSGWVVRVSEWDAAPSATTPSTQFSSFDAFGRAGTITAPDATVTTVAYSGVSKVERTVKVGTTLAGGSVQTSDAKTTETYDRFGRLYQVAEPGGNSTTTYAYDAADRLTDVSMVGSTGTQPRAFVYDGRGFLTSETHPENGTTSYQVYDARGHVGKKLVGATASAFDLVYDYDAAERLIRVAHPASRQATSSDSVKTFFFPNTASTTDHVLGKLQSATRFNIAASGTISVKETYAYTDAAGRLTSKITEVNGASGLIQKFTQPYDYNDLGLPSLITYPTCADSSRPCASSASTLTTLAPAYRNGLLNTLPGFATGVTYDLNGMVAQIDHPGGISDLITIASNRMARPARIQFNSYDPCTAPVITQHPASQQIASGGSASLSVTASSAATAPLTVQWFRDGSSTPIAGATSSTYSTGPLTASATFSARVFNSCGKADSSVAVISVCGTPSITAQPQNRTIATGTSTTLSVTATGCAPISYQWYSGSASDTSSPVGTSSSSFTTPTLTSSASYWVRVIDGVQGTVDSSTASVTVCSPPTITTQPQSQSSNSGSSVTLSVVAGGCATLSYQWYVGSAPSMVSPTGTNSASLNVSPIVSTSYWVRVTDSVGQTVNSNTATITIGSQLPTPGPITATYNPVNGAVVVTWGASAGATYYELVRYANGGTFTRYPTGASLVDDVVNPNTTYVYKVKAWNNTGSVASPYTTSDLATTMTFSTVQAGVVVAASHLEQLRLAVNAVRGVVLAGDLTWAQLLANYSGVPPPASGGSIKAAYILALRSAMDAARQAAGVLWAPYTDDLSTPTPIKAVDTTELQQRAQ